MMDFNCSQCCFHGWPFTVQGHSSAVFQAYSVQALFGALEEAWIQLPIPDESF
jgi:hypothetical protein